MITISDCHNIRLSLHTPCNSQLAGAFSYIYSNPRFSHSFLCQIIEPMNHHMQSFCCLYPRNVINVFQALGDTYLHLWLLHAKKLNHNAIPHMHQPSGEKNTERETWMTSFPVQCMHASSAKQRANSLPTDPHDVPPPPPPPPPPLVRIWAGILLRLTDGHTSYVDGL